MINLVVNKPPERDFKISISPSAQSIVQGQSAEFIVTVVSINEFEQDIVLSAAGLPSRASESFNPPVGRATFSSVLRIDTSESTPPGSFTITVIGEGGDKTHDATCTLIIEELPATPTLTETTAITTEATTPTIQTGAIPMLKGVLEDYNWLILILLIALAAVLGAVLLSRRRGAPPPTALGEAYCTECGARIPATVKYCPNCGAERRR